MSGDEIRLLQQKVFGQDAERISNIGEFFPVIFFLVAALVNDNHDSRMIEEQRQRIGNIKGAIVIQMEKLH